MKTIDKQIYDTPLIAVMSELDMTVEDIRTMITGAKTKVTGINFSCFEKLCEHKIVFDDFISGVQYEKNNRIYYMFAAAKSYYASPTQVAVGVGDSDSNNIYMVSEFISDSNHMVELLAFSKKDNMQSELSRFYGRRVLRERLLENTTDNDKKCLECGVEAAKLFTELLENQKIKRKKM